MERNAYRRDWSVRCRYAEQFARVNAFAGDVTDNQIALSYLHRDLVRSWRAYAKHLGRTFQTLAIECYAGDRRIVRHEVHGDELINYAPIARRIVVDRFDVAADQRLVLVRHPAHYP